MDKKDKSGCVSRPYEEGDVPLMTDQSWTIIQSETKRLQYQLSVNCIILSYTTLGSRHQAAQVLETYRADSSPLWNNHIEDKKLKYWLFELWTHAE